MEFRLTQNPARFSQSPKRNELVFQASFFSRLYSGYMGVSENSGTPKSSILIGFSLITVHFGVPLFLETTHILWVSGNVSPWMLWGFTWGIRQERSACCLCRGRKQGSSGWGNVFAEARRGAGWFLDECFFLGDGEAQCTLKDLIGIRF